MTNDNNPIRRGTATGGRVMSDAPERIRASGAAHPQWGVQFKCYPMPLQPMPAFKLTEYIRADLIDPAAIRAAALREAAEVAKKCAEDWWSEYKDITSCHAYNTHHEGMSDGADDVATAILSLIDKEPTK